MIGPSHPGEPPSHRGQSRLAPAALAAFASGVVIGTAVFAVKAGQRRFRDLVNSEIRALLSEATSEVGSAQLHARWDRLPEPIRRYLRFAIREGAPAIRTAHLRHGGLFRTAPGQRWLEITGDQYFSTAAPGFVWHATVRPVPFLWIEARDALIGGRGNMLVKLESTFALADARGSTIDQGASLRWLAECAWFPYAYAGDAIEWEAVDERSARATLRHGGLPVSAILDVDEQGKLTRLRAQRYRDVGGGEAVLTPWTGLYGDFSEIDGFRVPASVDVSWDMDDGPFSYARFRITTLEYNVPACLARRHPRAK